MSSPRVVKSPMRCVCRCSPAIGAVGSASGSQEKPMNGFEWFCRTMFSYFCLLMVAATVFGSIFCAVNWAASVHPESLWAQENPPMISLYASVPGVFAGIPLAILFLEASMGASPGDRK
jgi:hypothetical protein